MEILDSAKKHGIEADDIHHAVRNAVVIEELEDDLRLYLGPGRDASFLEVICLRRADGRTELAIHAMPMRPKYHRLLPGD